MEPASISGLSREELFANAREAAGGNPELLAQLMDAAERAFRQNAHRAQAQVRASMPSSLANLTLSSPTDSPDPAEARAAAVEPQDANSGKGKDRAPDSLLPAASAWGTSFADRLGAGSPNVQQQEYRGSDANFHRSVQLGRPFAIPTPAILEEYESDDWDAIRNPGTVEIRLVEGATLEDVIDGQLRKEEERKRRVKAAREEQQARRKRQEQGRRILEELHQSEIERLDGRLPNTTQRRPDPVTTQQQLEALLSLSRPPGAGSQTPQSPFMSIQRAERDRAPTPILSSLQRAREGVRQAIEDRVQTRRLAWRSDLEAAHGRTQSDDFTVSDVRATYQSTGGSSQRRGRPAPLGLHILPRVPSTNSSPPASAQQGVVNNIPSSRLIRNRDSRGRFSSAMEVDGNEEGGETKAPEA